MIKIGVLGLWHLGCVYSACFADKGFNVTAYDLDEEVVDNLQTGIPPIFEPGLEERVKKHNKKYLNFTNIPKEGIADKDYVFITLETPVDDQDRVSLKQFNLLITEVEKYINTKSIIVVSSQVPAGTCRAIKSNSVLYFPENLRLGQAIDGFNNPDRIVLGGEEKDRKKFLSDFSFFQCPVFEMSLESAEMSKHALNSYLATMISFSSEISDYCELVGANAEDVVKALKSDARVSPSAPLAPGTGFAGGTLGRDLQALKLLGKEFKYNPKLANAVYSVNQDRLKKLVQNITKNLGSLKGKQIGLLGLTYKPGTNTLRRSQSLELASLLGKQGAKVRAIDPAIKAPTAETKQIRLEVAYDKFFNGLDAVILMTGWGEFKQLEPSKFSHLMKQKVLFDTRNFLDIELWENAGFDYRAIGKGKIIN